MDGLTIGAAAARTGFSPSTLRWYEQVGLITPARTPAADEQGCCAFLRFDLSIVPEHVVLEVHGPEEARPVIDATVAA